MTDLAGALLIASLILTAVNGLIAILSLKHGAHVMTAATDALTAATAGMTEAATALTAAATAAVGKIGTPVDESPVIAATDAITSATSAISAAATALTDAVTPPVVEETPKATPAEQPQAEGEQAV